MLLRRLLLAISLSIPLACSTGIAPNATSAAVPVYEEPRHRLVYQNQYARVLDVRVPPGDVSLFHIHAAPLAGVVISDARYWIEKPGEPRSAPREPAMPGEPVENWAAALPYTHRVGNVDTVPLHYIAGEWIASPGIDAPPLPDTPTRRLFKEGEVARYYRITLEPGQSTEPHTHAQPGLTVHITADLVVDEGDSAAVEDGKGAGLWRWRNPNHTHILRNASTTRTDIIEVDWR